MIKASTKQPKRQKHVPQRTCIACRQTKSKRELLRVVRTPDGHIVLDPTGKKAGRGAYLCAQLSCWQKALKNNRRPKPDAEQSLTAAGGSSLLEHEFEMALPQEDREALEVYVATLPGDEATPVAKAQASRKKITVKQPGTVNQ